MKNVDWMGFGKLPKVGRKALAWPFLIILALSACDRMTDQQHIEKAKTFLNERNFTASTIELKNALEKNPDNLEARRLLGMVSLKMGNGPSAEKEFRRAVELGVSREALLVPLAEALNLQEKYQETVTLEGFEALPPSEQAIFMGYRGNALLGLKKPDEAKSEYESALALDPGTVSAKTGLARLAANKGDFGEAHRLLSEALARAPEDEGVWHSQGQVFLAEGKLSEAEESFSKAIEINPANTLEFVLRAMVRVDQRKFDAAEQDAAVLKKVVPNQFMTHHVAGVLAFAQHRLDVALEELEEAHRAAPGHEPTQFYLGATQFMLGHLAQADQLASQYLTNTPGSVKGIRLLALVKSAEKDFSRAKELLAPLLRERPNDLLALNLMGQIEFGLGRPEKGLVYLEKAVELAPTDTGSLMQLAAGYWGTGDARKGQETLEIATKLDPNSPQADLISALGYIGAKDFDKAEAAIAKLSEKEKMKGSPIPANMRGVIQRHQGNKEAARRSFEEALRIKPGWAPPVLNLAEMDLMEKNYGAARQVLNSALDGGAKNLAVELRLAEIDAIENKYGDMQTRLEAAKNNYPDALEPRLLLARLYLRKGEAERSQAILEEARPKFGSQPQLIAALVETQLVNGQASRGVESARSLVEAVPKYPAAYLMLARTYAEQGDLPSAMATLEKALQLDPKFFLARLDMVKALSANGKDELARNRFRELEKEYPNNPQVMSVKGWLAVRERKLADAIKAYARVLEIAPTSQAVLDLAQAYWSAGQKGVAVKTLEDWITEHRGDIKARYLLSLYYRDQGQSADVIAQLEAILDTSPDYAQGLADLAWELRQKDPKRALELAEKSVRLAPASPLILDTFGMVLLEHREEQRALTVLQQAQKADPRNTAIHYHVADALNQNGRTEEAIAELDDLLSKSGDFSEKPAAQKLLRQLRQTEQP